MRHATSLLYHVCLVASRNIRFASCGTSGNLLCGRASYILRVLLESQREIVIGEWRKLRMRNFMKAGLPAVKRCEGCLHLSVNCEPPSAMEVGTYGI
jgi:hypothetical protein